MNHAPSTLPLFARVLLRLWPLGDRRAEVAEDLRELFASRVESRGRFYAHGRLFSDLMSVARVPRALPAVPSRPRARFGGLGADVRGGYRLARRYPAVVGGTVVGLALAIAMGTTVFTILYGTAMRPYGMDDPASVVRVRTLFSNGSSDLWPYSLFATLHDGATHSRVEASLSEGVRYALAADQEAQPASILFVSGGYMSLLGGRAVVGRTLLPADDAPGAPAVVVVNHSFWKNRLLARADVVGSTLWLSGVPVTIAGVVDPAFTGPVDAPPAIWAPFAAYGPIYRDRPIDRTSTIGVHVIGRTPAAGRAAAAQELSAIAASTSTSLSVAPDMTASVTGALLEGAASPLDGPDKTENLIILSLIFVIVGLVLALACANVANLLLAAAASRAREIGIRLAMGATRGRIVRQLLTESLSIALVGGAAGMLLSMSLVAVTARLIGIPETYEIRPDAAAFAFCAGVAVLSGIGAGLAPARYGSRGDVIGAIAVQSARTGASRKTSRLRSAFVALQAAASIVLLVSAALFLRSALYITRVDVGFDAAALATVSPSFPRAYRQAETDAYWTAALARLESVPGVERAALVLYPPLGSAVNVTSIQREGRVFRVFENRSDAAYLAAAGLTLVRGRAFTDAEVSARAPVALISENVARDFFPDRDPIGAPLDAVLTQVRNTTIIGVVREAVVSRVRGTRNGMVYLPLDPQSRQAARIVVRSARPDAVAQDITRTLADIDPRVRTSIAIVSDQLTAFRNEPRVLAGVSTAIAVFALVLAVLGLHGVTAFAVRERRQEICVRLAIGASPGVLVRLLMRQSLVPVMVGLAVGSALSFVVAGLLTPGLSGIGPYDPIAIGGALAVLIGTAIAAVFTPALSAARSDPGIVLKDA